MASTASATPFRLGAYLGNPDNSSVANQALFDAKFDEFSKLMGIAPRFLTTFVDQNQPISQWVGNSTWAAVSAAQSSRAAAMTPVIALPLSSNAPGSMTSDQQFQAFASGQYDGAVTGIVQAWARAGFSNLVFRPGWEMNLTGPTFAGDDAQSQADWVKAFQHVYTVLHQAAAAQGVAVQVVWNPSTTNYSNSYVTTNLYPGDGYVDVVGIDMYADLHPYSDSSPTPTYHDWNTGLEDSTVAQFIADPVNRMHYWSHPAATRWAEDSSGGHSQSFDSLVRFAALHGKPLAIPEAGAGNSDWGVDVADDAAFPQWLSQQLAAAQASGVQIAFVNPWDSNGGGNYEFSRANDGKPAEAAAWARYLGATQTSVPVTPPPPPPPAAVIIGSGARTLALAVSEDAWQGDAQFTVSVDGKQVGGTQTATASHGAGQVQAFAVMGNFAAGGHTATVNFLNDAWGGTSGTDRNLYVSGAKIDGVSVPGAGLTLLSAGAQSFAFDGGAAAPASGTDTLDIHLSEDAWQGDAQFTVAIDGAMIGGVRTATALHASGASQDVSITGGWGAGPHSVAIAFINDAYGGTSATDRNLYVDQVSYDGRMAAGAPVALLSSGTAAFAVSGTAAPAITLHLAEDAWQGDAQFSVSVDGVTLIPTGTVTASNAQNQSQSVNLQAILPAGKHDLAVSFLNDAWGGTGTTDRNLYVKGVDVSGVPVSGAATALLGNGAVHFQIAVAPL
jgi:hypothetical protein